MSAQPQNDPKDMPKNNRDSVGEDSAISSLVSRIWNAKEEKGGITQMIKNFTSSTPPPTAPITTLSIQSEQGTTTSTITTTGTTTTTTKKDETTSIVFEKIRGLTSYIDNAPSALTSLLSSTPNSASPPVTSATVEEVTVKKLEVNQPPNVKRRSGTNAEPPKRGLLDYIQDKFTKKDEPKVGGLNITIKLVPGQEYNINMAQISQQQDKPSLNYTFDALMDKVRTIVVSNPSFPGNSSVDPSSPCFSISPPAPSYMPTSTSSGIDQQYLCTFLSILTKLEIVSAPPYTTKVTQLSKYASTMVNLQSLRVEGLPDITSLATETTSLKVLEDFRLVKLGLKSFPAELMQMTKLRTIDVSSNNINSLPSKGFGGLSKLEVLLLGSNQISSLPSDFTNLQNLNHLDLQKNKFDINTVTPILVDLCSPGQNYTSTSVTSPQPIRDANASSGRASPVVPRRTEPVELRTLNFSGNKAAALPLSFAKLTSLTNLDMSSSEMSLWPNEVLHSLTRLVTLNLGHNHIAHLPHDLPRLASMSKLILASNTLKKIPIEFCPTYPSLTELDLSANKLSSLPENFSTLRSLKLLRLHKNDFEGEIPQQILALSTLTELDLSDNSLDKWWSDDKALRKLDSLVTLNLSANDLTEIGPGIGSLSALLSLDLSQNNLAALPPQIGKLTSLRNLQLHTNPMDKFPSEFSRLTKLTKLSAGNVTISEKEVGSVNEEQVNLFRLTSIAKSAPHPLIVIALGILCERDELHQQMMDTGTIHVLVHFTDSSHFDIKLDATKSLCVLSINENLREDLFGAASARLMELCEDKNTQIQVYALTTLGNIAFKETVRLGMLTKYGHQLFAKLAKDKLQDMGVRKKSRRVLAILGINEFFLPWNPKKKGVRILTIDGGGTRGVATLELLKKLEEITGKRLHQLFDLVGGTSTGAQLCAAMSVRQLPLVEYQRMYIEQCANIFTTTTTTAAPAATAAAAAAADATSATSTWSTALSSQWAKISLYSNVLTTGAFYKSKNLEDALIAFFEDRILIDTIEDYDLRFFATSTLVNTLPSQPYIFRNYQYPVNSHSRYLGSCTARVWQALRASTAAPSYFDEFTMGNDRFQDGGIVANNPTAIAYHEARKIWGPDVKIDCVVSLGTGKPPPKQTKNSIKDTIITLVDSATSTDRIHEIMEDVIPEGRYFRFNPLDEAFSVDLDETRQEKLEAMQVAARKYIVENEDLFKKACKLLMGDES